MSFGFQYKKPQEMKSTLNSALLARGLGQSTENEITKFWLLSMDMLKQSLRTTAEELVRTIPAPEIDYNTKIKTFEDALSKVSWSDNDITLSPSEFYNKFFAHCVNVRDIVGPKGSWRDLYEHIGASNQCKAAINKLNEIISWNTCYICGLEILDEKGIHDTRECEHILPAFTSLGYKGLIQTSKLNENYTDDQLKFFRYEYANAHRCCNQIKSDDKWIKYNQGLYVADEAMLKTTLKNIFDGTAYDCTQLKLKSNFKGRNFIQERSNFIVSTFLNPILNIINNDKKEYGDLFDLNVRIKQVTALKENIDTFAYAFLNGTAPPKIHSAKQLNFRDAMLLAKKQFKNPIDIFFDVFNDIFSNVNSNAVQILWSTLFGNQKLFRNFVTIARRLYDSSEVNGEEIKNKIFNNNMKKLNEIYSHDEFVDEDKIISLNNVYLLNLTNEYRVKIFNMTQQGLAIPALQISEKEKQDFFSIIQKSATQDKAEDDILKERQTSIFNETRANLVKKGGNKNNISDSYMIGGFVADEELIQSYKDDVLETAEKLGFNPLDYGINVQTTQYGRKSIPKLPLTYDSYGRQGVQIGDKVFLPTADGKHVVDETTGTTIPVEWEVGKGRGIRDNAGNFFSIGGKKPKKSFRKLRKIRKRTHKRKIYHKTKKHRK